MNTHTKHVIKNCGTICQLQATEINGLPAYYFVSVRPEKRRLLEKVISLGDFDVAKYGEILLSGYGIPGSEQKEYMFKNFGFTAQ